MSYQLYAGTYPTWQLGYIPTLDEWKSWFSKKIDWTGNVGSDVLYADRGANIMRVPDRAFVGGAADNPGASNRDETPTDWLSALMATTTIGAWPMWGATFAATARYGSTGILGASRTSDSAASSAALGYTPSSIGIASWGIDDDTATQRTTTAYAFYGEVWRMENVVYQPCFGMELEAVNFGGLPTGYSTPYHPNVGGGAYTIQLGAGGGQSAGTSDAESAITLVSNPNKFRQGVVFSATSLTGTDGNTTGSYGSAIVMATYHGIEWRTPETAQSVEGLNSGGMIYSTTTQAANGQRIEFSDNGLLFLNSSGALLASVGTVDAPSNSLQLQAGSGTQAAGVYVQAGNDGSANLGLFPAANGVLQITSPVTAAGATLANANTPAGWLHININGSDYRVALFSSAQAGG